jgi:integrase
LATLFAILDSDAEERLTYNQKGHLGQHTVSDTRDEGRAASTRNKYVQLVKAMFRWGVKKGYLVRNPVAESETIKREKHAKRSRPLVADVLDDKGKIVHEGEERRLLAVAGPHLQRLIIGALETGMRRGGTSEPALGRRQP